MPKYIEGMLEGRGFKIAIVVSRFNSFITERLIDGALDAFIRSGVKDEDITIIKTPGSFEIPAVAKRVANSEVYKGILCLGAVIRGDTPHFDFVSAEAIKGIAQVAMEAPIPISMGILTTDTLDQAIDRAGAKSGNKGFDAARVLIEMINVYNELD